MAYGIPKSGSTLAFELTRGLLLKLGHPQEKRGEIIGKAHKVNFLPRSEHGNNEILRRLDESVPANEILVVKTHSAPTQMMRDMARDRRLICQAVFRDPRDIALSLRDAGARARVRGRGGFLNITDMNLAVSACSQSFEIFEQWCEVDGVLTACYDEVAFRSEVFLSRVLAQMGLGGEEVDLGTVGDEVKRGRFTQFNKGVSRRYRQDLSLAAALKLTARFADVIERHMGPQLDAMDHVLLEQARRVEVPESFVGLYDVSPASPVARPRVPPKGKRRRGSLLSRLSRWVAGGVGRIRRRSKQT